MNKLILAATAAFALSAPRIAASQAQDVARWQRQAQAVTITRDDWGIAHVRGKTDADAVFGLIYAQAEDDFNRVETNYINSIGRLAEAEGESAIWQDLRMKLFIDPDSMKAKYTASPAWLKALMDSWADGLNFYLYKHPDVTPKVIKHFEPWMALTFSEGSIGGDIEKVNLRNLAAFYGKDAAPTPAPAEEDASIYKEPGGSNGIAIAPSNTQSHHALLWINPHTSFFFRSELQATSDEGLNAYGAVTWGQFFIYQGFNAHAGWMHTSSSADATDEYLETVVKKGDKYYYKYGNEERPMISSVITVPYKSGSGMAKKQITVYRTQHGPVIRDADGKWVTFKLMQEPVKALTQSYMRTKAKNYAEFMKTMELHTNSSNNTIFADAEGNIAYIHANFVPKRDTHFDWRQPVDGSNPATEWQGLLSVQESPLVHNPASGWLYNTNNSPWTAAGPNSPKKSDFPAYVDNGSENARSVHAIMLLEKKKDFTRESLMATGFDSYLPFFAEMIPNLVKAYEATPASNPLKAKVADQIAMLRGWDYRWSETSIPTSLGVFYGDEVGRAGGGGRRGGGGGGNAGGPTAEQQLQALAAASDKLTTDFGTWKTPWGDINRFQRLTGDIVQPFNDAGPSIPVGFVSSRWGSLASFGASPKPGTKKWYGTSGNSFVAVVEFGDSVRARAVSAGGEDGNPKSKHFNDQATRYAKGNLRDVYFYPSQLKGHTERVYHPGS